MNRDVLFPEPQTVHIDHLKGSLSPLKQSIENLVSDTDIIMLGEGDHFDEDTKLYTKNIFSLLIETQDKKAIVFLEAKNISVDNLQHYEEIVKICEEKNIPYFAVDTANTGNNSLDEVRDIAMSTNIEEIMKNSDDGQGIFIGGSNHCNKDGTHMADLDNKYSDGYNHQNTASLLKSGFRIKTMTIRPINNTEVLAKTIDNSDEIMSLSGEYAPLYNLKSLDSLGQVTSLRFDTTENSYDLIAFIPTRKSRFNKKFGKNPGDGIVYIDKD